MIYFIRTASRPYVKIGYCSGDACVRMSSLQVGSVDQLILVGTMEGEQEDERNWHRRYAYARVRGEWFEYTPDLQKAIALALGHHLPSPETVEREKARALEHLMKAASAGRRRAKA